ncbi:MAG TPA: hypothetical protein VK153_03870 [Candidatus Paceibacterota bacterium]|nr:hypothetical protein [Candidatus Paceibacterota bacterium]
MVIITEEPKLIYYSDLKEIKEIPILADTTLERVDKCKFKMQAT